MLSPESVSIASIHDATQEAGLQRDCEQLAGREAVATDESLIDTLF
jgi:hypothetical protein